MTCLIFNIQLTVEAMIILQEERSAIGHADEDFADACEKEIKSRTSEAYNKLKLDELLTKEEVSDMKKLWFGKSIEVTLELFFLSIDVRQFASLYFYNLSFSLRCISKLWKLYRGCIY